MLPNQKLFDELGDKISQAVHQGPFKDIEHNLRALVQSTLQKLDIVTREEFDVQQEVLLRTREQLVALETRITELEKMITPPAA
ncbi:MAG: accessory factor UbiK family protein [Sulfuriferula sp.]|jgi:ubiquinone biosynthesis accessory factor UbiK|nr:accessory factor UbiK family protein [Sulfuriferula sp.]